MSAKLDQPTRRFFWNSLRVWLIAAFVALSVVPLVMAMGVTISRNSAQARQQAINQLDSIAETKAHNIEQTLANEQGHLRTVFADPDGQALAVSLLTAPADDEALRQQAAEYLSAVQGAHGVYEELFVYNVDGEILASSNPAQIGKIVRRQAYFDPSLAGEYLQPPFYDLGTQALNIILARPLVDAQSSVIGGLAGRLNLEQLNAIMVQRTGLGDTGETYLVSLESNYLVTPSRFEGYSLTQSYHSEAIDRALNGESGTDTYSSYREQAVFGAYRWLPQLQVALVAEIEVNEALRSQRESAQFSMGLAGAAALLAATVGFWVALRITEPISKLTSAARTFAGGDLKARVQISTANEIGELGAAFNAMASRLEETLRSLEKSVQEARTATAMAREANRLKSEFLSTMSHELRTPLNAIIGFTEIMLAGMSGPMSEQQQHKISRIHLNSKRLLDLINDLLDLAKIEAGRVELVSQEFSPRDFAATVSAQMEVLAEQRGVGFEVHVDPNLPSAMLGDVARIEQATKNLLSNAFKFTKEGRVEMALHANGGETWEIIVVDTGIGIPPHALDYIFDEFRQVDGTSQRAYGGSGLGLSITRNLARIMGGEVRVASTVGKGSTFTITLPLIVPEMLERAMA